MRASILKFAEWAVAQIPVAEPIVEFGALQAQSGGLPGNVRHLFPDRDYVGADFREGPGVDKVLDLHAIALDDDSVGTVVLLETLEHVEHPHKALEEIHRILKPGGHVLMTSCMFFPIHNYPFDYWRFTPEAFQSLLKRFGDRWVGVQGDPFFPYSLFGIGRKGPESDGLADRLDSRFPELKFPFESYAFILNACPPCILSWYRRFRRAR